MNLSYLSPRTIVKESRIHGRGLFARQPVAKGEIVAIKGGYILAASTLPEVERRLGPAEIPVADGFFIAPLNELEREGAMIFTNHSCDPNIGVQGQIVFVAIRDIEAGEELTHDWATTDDDDYELECKCGAPNCRKRITGKDWQKREFQQKYEGYISTYLSRRISGSKREPQN